MEDNPAVQKIDSSHRFYIQGQQMSWEEDLGHEFKGHRSISLHDIHNMCLQSQDGGDRTRNAVSISLCAMLNSGHGGTVYLGITDSGIVRGLSLSQYQKDHMEASLEWTFSRFTPLVSDDRYSCCFVPVLSSKNQQNLPTDTQAIDNERRSRPHHVAQPNYCWCDIDAAAQHSLGKLSMAYVVEIHVRPWDPHKITNLRNSLYSSAPPLPPLHLTEANGCHFRQSCRQPRLCLEDVRRLLVHRVQEHFTLKLTRLQARYNILMKLAQENNIRIG
ncbi:unnamed protein product [Meganyctiphanes norvegica]|uniref:Schlafen AlbA-2 domain-containing protein n=1 Tax=Meganyctiphanes norvegica TaxID=48144 RepID=A0AAV2R8G6_MEGNR